MHMFGGRLVFLNLMPSQTARPTITNEQGQYWSETAFFSKRFWFCKKDPSETLPGHRHWRSDRLDFSKLQSHYIKRLVNCDWAVKAGLYEMEIESQWRLYSQAGLTYYFFFKKISFKKNPHCAQDGYHDFVPPSHTKEPWTRCGTSSWVRTWELENILMSLY